MINVLILIHNLQSANGVASFAMNYFRQLDSSEVHVDFAVYADESSPHADEIRQAGSTIYSLPQVTKLNSHIKRCREILSSKKYDVIHDNTLHISIPMMWCAKRAGVPVRILHSHNAKLGETPAREARNKLFLPLLRGLATDYAACSKLAGDAMFGKRIFTVIPNVIAVKKYYFDAEKRAAIRRQMNAENVAVIGTVGRLAEQKNPFFALEIFEQVLKKNPAVEYWWVGNGPLQNQIEQYVKDKGLSEHVRLLGSRDDVLDLYQAMDCFFLPSLFEGLPVTGVEAQAMGLPMVVSATVTDEMVYTDLVDYVSLDETPEIWAEHLLKALERTIDRMRSSELLKQSIFSDAGCGERMTGIYKELLQKRGGE